MKILAIPNLTNLAEKPSLAKILSVFLQSSLFPKVLTATGTKSPFFSCMSSYGL